MLDPDKDFIRLNKILNKRASIGPIPADQVLPWMGFIGLAYLVCYMLLDLGFNWFLMLSVWWIASWWLLTGKRSYHYTDQWTPLPGKDWINANTLWVSATDPGSFRRKKRLTPIRVPLQQGGNEHYMPFQNYSDLHAIAQISIAGHSFAALILEKNNSWSAVIPFEFKGLHTQLEASEITQITKAISEAMKQLPIGEHLTMMMGCYSSDSQRAYQLEQLADNCELSPIAVLHRNEQLRVAQITQSGLRRVWQQMIFCTWSENIAARQQDFLTGVLESIINWWNRHVRRFTGSEGQYWKDFYSQLATKIYHEGFLPWQLTLETKAALSIKPMNSQQLWEWLWYRFNQHQPPPIPQLIEVLQTHDGLQTQIHSNNAKDTTTVLIQGENSHSHTPSHSGSRERVYVNRKVCGVLTMEELPSGWSNLREQLKWIWERLAGEYVRDTEAWIEISRASKALTQDNLVKLAKQATTANKWALKDGFGQDVGARVNQEESFEAQKKLYSGVRPLYCAPLFLVYRPTAAELDKACAILSNCFGSAKVIRERNIAWQLWLETLPLNTQRMLRSSSMLTERRQVVDTSTIAGLMPLTAPKDIDSEGVEMLTAGGYPLYIDLFSRADRCLITGKSGSGKSVLGYRFIMDALAQGIRVLGMDLSSAGDSTFKLATEILGEQGAYLNIVEESLNLLQPPDLRGLASKQLQLQRFRRWKEFLQQAIVAIAMGKISDVALSERVNSITLRLLETFFSDPEIIDRYNEAFEQGWKSLAWQYMPTLHDLLNFCSREKLGIYSYEDIDKRAINQIYNQIEAKLIDPNIGHVIGKPSTIAPEPLMKIFALSGLSNENNAYILAIMAQMACLSNALAYPKSLFVGDELSVLLSKDGFASLVGEIFATGRKEGISSLILAQDIDAISHCSAAAQILQNLSVVITGRTTTAAANSYHQILNYPLEIISRNASESYLPNSSEYYTHWLVSKSDRFWDCRFFPGAMTLAALANSSAEKAARARILANYPTTTRGYLQGLQHFSIEYIAAIRGSKNLAEIGLEEPATTPH